MDPRIWPRPFNIDDQLESLRRGEHDLEIEIAKLSMLANRMELLGNKFSAKQISSVIDELKSIRASIVLSLDKINENFKRPRNSSIDPRP